MIDFYKKLEQVAPEKTVFATNSSTLLQSPFAEATGRPEKFLGLHFANEIWKNNDTEVMKHPGTEMKIFDAVCNLRKAIGMVALLLHKDPAARIGYFIFTMALDFALV